MQSLSKKQVDLIKKFYHFVVHQQWEQEATRLQPKKQLLHNTYKIPTRSIKSQIIQSNPKSFNQIPNRSVKS